MKVTINYVHPRGKIERVELDGEIWELEGECNRCGECCEKTQMPIEEFRNKNGMCKYYCTEIINGELMGRCDIMWNRPAFCMMYPSDPHYELHKKCGFKWKRIK